jgi:DNA polymerase III subunit epsilon
MPHPSTFTAIDFETASSKWHTICSVGLVRVEKGKIVQSIEYLVKPPNNEYHYRNTDIHGLTPKHTVKALTFDKIWHKIEPYINGQNVVAHNMSFDGGCIKKTLEYYKLPIPEFTPHCTMKIFGGKLDVNCKKHGIKLNHHNALSDATGCAKLFLIYLKTAHK